MWRGRGSGGGGGGRGGDGMNYKKKPGSGNMGSVPPPAYLTLSNAAGKRSLDEAAKLKEEQYAALMYGHTSATSSSSSKSSARQKRLYDDEYLEGDDDDGATDEAAYQPAPGSPSADQPKSASGDQDEEDDPLDAFMADINQQAKKDKEASERHEVDKDKAEKEDKKKLGRTDIDEEDMQESYFRFLEEQKAAAGDDDEVFEYDEDGNVIWTWKKVIDPLPPIDHASVDYAPFERHFYAEHSDISALNHLQTEQLRETLGIKASGLNAPKPVTSFAHFGFDEQLMSVIRKSEYTQPTSIQAQAIPAILSGRDVIGIAKTGSGKTAAYLWPALVHIMHQSELKPGDGPIALIVVPTRELAIQVYHEAKRFGKVYNINVVCAYGGGSKWEQQNALTEGAEIVVATPGRIIDMVKIGATNFTRVTYMVFDEADRMFDMGFERQVRSIADHVRPDRQCLMFSATFKKRVERLAREQLNDAVRIVQGEIGEANEDIKQTVEVMAAPPDKWIWLTERLIKFSTVGKVLIFVTRKQNAEELATNLKTRDMPVCLLHGDMQQVERNETISAFRKEIPILVATDVAARGLDIPEIRTVINFDVARDIDTHVHRIGRTGRAGEKGEAFTLVTEKDKEFAGHLVRNLESVNQPVPEKLMQLAVQAPWFRKSRNVQDGASGQSSGPNRLGLGFKPRTRPGFGTAQASSTPSASSAFLAGGSGGGTRPHQDSFSKTQTQASGGPTNRIAALKAAYSSSYKNTFQSASGNELTAGRAPVTDPTPEWKRQLDQVNASLQSSSSEADKRKRSRWE